MATVGWSPNQPEISPAIVRGFFMHNTELSNSPFVGRNVAQVELLFSPLSSPLCLAPVFGSLMWGFANMVSGNGATACRYV